MDLVELQKNAIDVEKNPAYVIDFSGDVWVMIPKEHFDLVREYLESY